MGCNFYGELSFLDFWMETVAFEGTCLTEPASPQKTFKSYIWNVKFITCSRLNRFFPHKQVTSAIAPLIERSEFFRSVEHLQ